MEKIIEWCEHHNAKLVMMKKNGFVYSNLYGWWYMSYDEMGV